MRDDYWDRVDYAYGQAVQRKLDEDFATIFSSPAPAPVQEEEEEPDFEGVPV